MGSERKVRYSEHGCVLPLGGVIVQPVAPLGGVHRRAGGGNPAEAMSFPKVIPAAAFGLGDRSIPSAMVELMNDTSPATVKLGSDWRYRLARGFTKVPLMVWTNTVSWAPEG